MNCVGMSWRIVSEDKYGLAKWSKYDVKSVERKGITSEFKTA